MRCIFELAISLRLTKCSAQFSVKESLLKILKQIDLLNNTSSLRYMTRNQVSILRLLVENNSLQAYKNRKVLNSIFASKPLG